MGVGRVDVRDLPGVHAGVGGQAANDDSRRADTRRQCVVDRCGRPVGRGPGHGAAGHRRPGRHLVRTADEPCPDIREERVGKPRDGLRKNCGMRVPQQFVRKLTNEVGCVKSPGIRMP